LVATRNHRALSSRNESSPGGLPARVVVLYLKGFEFGLRPLRFQSRFPASCYWVIGDGPERKRLENLTRSLTLASTVRFWATIEGLKSWNSLLMAFSGASEPA
jgi:hypothetical protein